MAITPAHIVKHRQLLKQSGMVGCVTGRPESEMGSGVQIWYRDASGRLNGDRMNPYCFCFDCRCTFDRDGSIDAKLVNSGNAQACYVYAPLLSQKPTRCSEEPLPSISIYIPLEV